MITLINKAKNNIYFSYKKLICEIYLLPTVYVSYFKYVSTHIKILFLMFSINIYYIPDNE